LGQSLHERVKVYVGGSAALIIPGYLSRQTQDVDIVDELPKEIRSQRKLLDELQQRYRLQVAHFQSHYLPTAWQNRAHFPAGFDPRKEVRGFDDLKKFGLFEDDWLRGGPVRRWVPKAYHKKPTYVFETGGTTGIPKSRVVVDDFRIDYEMFSETLPDKYFPRG